MLYQQLHIKHFLLIIFWLSLIMESRGQDFSSLISPTSRPGFQVSITMVTPLQFGDFYPSEGGEVIISDNGNRHSSGSVILLPSGPMSSASILEIRALPMKMMQIQISDELWLQGSNGGQLRLFPGPLSRGVVFVTPSGAPSGFTVGMGGRLQVRPLHLNPAGAYSGTIYITIISQ